MYQAAKDHTLDIKKVIDARLAGDLTDRDVHILMGQQAGKTLQSFLRNPLLRKNYDICIADIKGRFKPIEDFMRVNALKGEDMGALPGNEAATLFTKECEAADARGELTSDWMRARKEEIVKVYMEDALRKIKRRKGGKPVGTPAPSPRPGGKPKLFDPTGPGARQKEGW